MERRLELESDGLALFGTVLGTDPALFQLLQLSLRFPYSHLYFMPMPAPPYPWAVLPLSLVFFLSLGSRGQQSVGIDHRGCESLAASGRRALLMAHYQEDAPERQGHRS